MKVHTVENGNLHGLRYCCRNVCGKNKPSQNSSATVVLACREKEREKYHLAEPYWCYGSDQFSTAFLLQITEEKQYRCMVCPKRESQSQTLVRCFFNIAQSLSPVRTLQMNTVVYFGITVPQDSFYTLQNLHPSV